MCGLVQLGLGEVHLCRLRLLLRRPQFRFRQIVRRLAKLSAIVLRVDGAPRRKLRLEAGLRVESRDRVLGDGVVVSLRWINRLRLVLRWEWHVLLRHLRLPKDLCASPVLLLRMPRGHAGGHDVRLLDVDVEAEVVARQLLNPHYLLLLVSTRFRDLLFDGLPLVLRHVMDGVRRLLVLSVVVRVLVLPQPISHPDFDIMRLRYRLLGSAGMLRHVGEVTLRCIVLIRRESVVVEARIAAPRGDSRLVCGEARIFVFVRTNRRPALPVKRCCDSEILGSPLLQAIVAVPAPLHLLYQEVAVVLVQLVGHHGLVVVQVGGAEALHVLLVKVEIDTLIVDLLLQYFIVLILDEFGQCLLVVDLGNVLLRRRHREFEVVVEVAEAIDDGAELLILLLQDLDLIC